MTELSARLAAAVAAARAAGDLLRAEMRRPGGPRGEGGKCPADAEAEDLVRTALTAAFPDDGFRAEERPEANRAGRGPSPFTWLVDPNDGTSAMQRGQRGPTVSIALLREGEPVLGVVYAYAAPDDEGDLLAWAEGCGPLTRNGTPVAHPGWPERFGPYDVVLVSAGADARPRENLLPIAPARYRPVPGIAYRLALAAAGEGVTATSLFKPRDFDIAAGHALLRAVGGVVLDERGRPVAYHPERPRQLGFCFAGGPALASALARYDWQDTLRAPEVGRDPHDRVRPRRDLPRPATGRLARAQGCWLGQLAGDALGSQVEFRGPGDIRRQHPHGVREILDGGTFNTLAGQPTDDSELALMLARTLAAGRHGYDADAAARAYRFWFESRPFDIGGTTATALRAATGPLPAASAEAAGNRGSQANGALMRISPLGIAGCEWPEAALVDAARADAAITHPNPVCRDANVAFALAIAFAIREGAGPRAVYDYALSRSRALNLHADVVQTLEDAAEGPPADFMHQMGWVRLALRNAFWRLYAEQGFTEALVDTVGRGGDTDTNGCIAGALLGAVHGRDGIPAAWRQRVLTCRPLAGLPHVRQPRPKSFWPVDALLLPEVLLSVAAP